MPKTRELSREQRAQIKILAQQRMSTRKIANIMNIAQSTVVYTMQRYKEKQSSTPRKRSGRPCVTTKGSDWKIHRSAVKNPTLSSTSTAIETRCNASTRTVRRRLLQEFNLPSRRPAEKARLSSKNIRDRITFCKKYKDWTEDQWLGVTFSDESTFSQFSSYVRHVHRPPGQRYNIRYVVPMVKQAPTTMVWGCFSGRGRGALWFMLKNTTMNGPVYLRLLQDKLLLHMGILGSTVFQQDGAPCHRTAAVSRCLANSNIEVLGPWSGSSPDLNPIENMWIMIKEKVSKLNPTSEATLADAIKNVWVKDVTPAYCERLARSMPSRIRDVLAAKGQHSKY